MFNPLPLLALGAIGLGYASAIDHVDKTFEGAPIVEGFTASPNLSVHDFVGRLPETVQDPWCDERETVAASLSDDFAETLESEWVQEHAVKMELWASDLMGTWTLLTVAEDGLTCILSSGFGWADGMDAESLVQIRPIS